ncbi:CidA/LrgA family protein [Litchfieldia alkalitelluris]|uniref:CidA/LrgA family protein n=1 Tax=Litchfieldia alkalitelluris TaxID=304268 RepID=UPI000997B08F|nr:CidA/LrgA family holin-like protein [Litchfieldia alkalitelluris]
MKFVLTAVQIAGLYGIYYIGCLIQEFLKVSIPGSIIGMLLLFLLLQLNIVKEKWFAKGSGFLLTYLAILFVPATVGLVDYLPYFYGSGFITLLIAFISTVLVMSVSGLISQSIATREERKQQNSYERGFDA